MNDISKDSFLYIVERILSYAKDASKEAQKKRDPFSQGECLAFHKVAQVIENELSGLGISLENEWFLFTDET